MQVPWSYQLGLLREAIQGLSSGVERLQRPADAWLQQFSASPGSWRLCIRLLETPDVQLNECFYAANNLRTVCLKHQDVLEVVTLGELLPQLAYHLQTCLHRQQWAPANQLAAAIAALAARSPSMQANALPQAICSSFSAPVAQALAEASTATTTAATTAAAAASAAAAGGQPTSPVGQQTSQWGYSGWHSNLGSQTDPTAAAAAAASAATASARSQEVLQVRLQQEPLVLAALLQVLAALPETLQSRQVLWYTFDRREAVKSGLLTSNSTTLVVAAALCSQNPRLIMLSCDVLAGLCELGSAPIGLEVQTGALQVMAGALMSSVTCQKAADALAALAASCKGCIVAGVKWQLLQLVAQQLQQTVFPALTAQHESTVTRRVSYTSTGSSTSQLTTPPGAAAATSEPIAFVQVVGSQSGVNAEAAFAKMLGAVSSALLTPVLQGAEVPSDLMDSLLQQLLLGIGSEDDNVAMVCVHFWQEEYGAQVQALPPDQNAAALLQHQPITEALATALVRRTELRPAALGTATADARDLPEDMRMMRRELAAAIRDLGKLIGHITMLEYMVKMVTGYHHAWKSALAAAGEHGDIIPAALSPAATTACLKLEGGLYASNVVLGRLIDVVTPEVDALIKELVLIAADAATNHTKIHKLAGTALTLMGGLPGWLVRNQQYLPQVLTADASSLRSPDDKLARNAATTAQRLTSCEELAALLFAAQPAHVQALLAEYQRRGGLPVTLLPSVGDDLSTEELLLLALCSIAVAHSSSSNSIADINSILSQLVGPQLEEASAELAAALQGNWPQQLPSVLEAPLLPLSLPKPHTNLHKQRRGLPQTRQQSVPPNASKAAVCFEAMAKLVAGLPTGVHKYAIGVPMHTKTPWHQHMVDEVSKMLGVGPPVPLGMGFLMPGQRPPAPPPPPPPPPPRWSSGGGGAAGSSSAATGTVAPEPASAEDSDSDDSPPSSPGSSAADQGPGPSGTILLNKMLSVGQGRQQPRTPLDRQRHACLFVSQLVVQASQAVTLALQAAAVSFNQPQTEKYGSQLLTAVLNFMQSALPATLHYDMLVKEQGATGEAGQQAAGGLEGSAVHSVLQPSALILQLCQLMERLPVELLQLTSSLQLLLIMITCSAVAGILPAEECFELESLREQSGQQGAGAMRAPSDRQHQQLLMLLQRLVGLGLSAACQSIAAQGGSADDELATAALSLAAVCLRTCPAVLVSVDVGLLFSITLVASKTYHLKQVTALLDWVQTAVYGAYAQVQSVWDASGGSSMMIPAAAAATAGVGFGRNLLAALRVRLEAGMGVQLVLALMMAASGSMPSDVVLPVALCLHAIWLSVGPQLFQAWLQTAVLQAAVDSAPWGRVRHMLKLQFIQTLTERSCLTDTTKFKGILKSFCGGRKKGPGRY